MPLSRCRIIAADNRCTFSIRAALPELIVIYEHLPITTQARHYATRGSIMTAALPFGGGPTALILQIGFLLSAVYSPALLKAYLRSCSICRIPTVYCCPCDVPTNSEGNILIVQL